MIESHSHKAYKGPQGVNQGKKYEVSLLYTQKEKSLNPPHLPLPLK